MTHEDIQSLLGVYALDALDPEEAAEVEEHLAECPRCSSEVAAFRNTAALLATPGGEAPPGLWDRIASELAFDDGPSSENLPNLLTMPPPRVGLPEREAAPPPRVGRPVEAGARASAAPPANAGPPSNVVPMRRRRRGAQSVVGAVAAAAAVAAIVLGVSASHLNSRVNDLSSALHANGLNQAAASAVLDNHHQEVRLTSATTHQSMRVVVLPNGNAYLVSSDLPGLSAERTYQLWGLTNGKVVSLGLLGANPSVAAFRVEHGVTRLMVTAEPKGGVPAPTTPVLVQGNVLA